MNKEVKRYADAGDIKSLKYIFVDALDVDPTFVQYEEEYQYCKAIPGLLEPHVELTPFRSNRVDWDEKYWTKLKMDLMKNFSDKRMLHMRDVAQVFLAEKVRRIREERARNDTARSTSAPTSTPTHGQEQPIEKETAARTPHKTSERRAPSVSNRERQEKELEDARRKLEAENRAEREREERVRRARMQHREDLQRGGNEVPKKAIGIAVAAAAAAVVLVLFLK